MAKLKALLAAEDGQGMVEYALIAALISVVAIVTIRLIGPRITAIYQSVLDALT